MGRGGEGGGQLGVSMWVGVVFLCVYNVYLLYVHNSSWVLLMSVSIDVWLLL